MACYVNANLTVVNKLIIPQYFTLSLCATKMSCTKDFNQGGSDLNLENQNLALNFKFFYKKL